MVSDEVVKELVGEMIILNELLHTRIVRREEDLDPKHGRILDNELVAFKNNVRKLYRAIS